MAAPIRNIVKTCFQNSVYRHVTRKQGTSIHRCMCSTTTTDSLTKYEDLRLFKREDERRDTTDDYSQEIDGQDYDTDNASFATLFRHSKFVQMGDLKHRKVIGKIFQVVNDDLYIDFGGKFMCCCPRPQKLAEKFFKGQRVILLLNSFEMVGKFMGSEKAVTLLEADCTLIRVLDDNRQLKPERRRDKDLDKFGDFDLYNEVDADVLNFVDNEDIQLAEDSTQPE